MNNTQSPIELSRDWLEAKTEEEEARDRRVAVEEELIKQLGVKAEGSKTHDLGEFKVTVTGVISRTLDKEVWESIKDKLPPEIRPVTYEPKLDVTGVKWLQEHQPEDYKILARALVIKPGKVGVKVIQITKTIKEK
jgi:hypothetical protein